ncbi:MAG: trypsin-like peptidase domain-containing protein [Xanthobacteraceae bacterium]|nr:trypsin-like peptidase domain-containing protein [Xanthobacteraceae bacterium]
MPRSRHRILLVAAVACGLAWAYAPAQVQGGVPLGIGADADGMPSLAPLLKKVTPGVVSIAVKGRIGEEQNPLLKDPEIRRSLNMPKGAKSIEISGAGSGVVFDAKNGLIVTNNHILEYADEITVALSDGRKLPGKRVGGDTETDIALIRVAADGLTPIPLGDSDKLEVGDFVLAIGNPFQIGQTVTSGIVGGLRRSGLGIENYEEFIQTDASINPGNSGGALVNLRGELVGINTAVVGDNGGRTGIGFAIPVNMARAVVDQILVHGDIQRGQLGITIETLSPEAAREKNLPAQQAGAVITKIEPGSAAERAGAKLGDIITQLGGSPVRDATDLRNRLGALRLGEAVELAVLRGDQQIVLRATLAKRPQKAAVQKR